MARSLTLALAASCFAVSLAVPATAQETRLKAVSFLPLSRSAGIQLSRWIEEFNTRGKGLLHIDGLGPEAMPVMEQPNAVRTGVVQMQFGPPTYYAGIVPEADALALAEISTKEMRA